MIIMELSDKLKILSEDSRYDLACACGTLKNEHRRRGNNGRWLYPVPLQQGGYTVLLKTLLSNACVNDCKYCPLRAETDIRRCTIQPEEVARIFMEYKRKGKVFGLFLSSAVIKDADYTMDKLNAAARILRYKYNFKGYIHLKIIPGSSNAAIEDSLSLATAVSLNIETPDEKHYSLLSQKKDYAKDIIRPLKLLGSLTGKGMKYSGVKCTTQFIVGASSETDSEIVNSMFELYNNLNFKRVYFSAYQKGLGNSDIPGERIVFRNSIEPFLREHRLYQVDFLLRKYNFNRKDILFDEFGNLRHDKDPKELWCETHPEFFPVKINSDDRNALLRVPGIGPETASLILKTRKEKRIRRLEDIGLKGKRLEKAKKYVIFE